MPPAPKPNRPTPANRRSKSQSTNGSWLILLVIFGFVVVGGFSGMMLYNRESMPKTWERLVRLVSPSQEAHGAGSMEQTTATSPETPANSNTVHPAEAPSAQVTENASTTPPDQSETALPSSQPESADDSHAPAATNTDEDSTIAQEANLLWLKEHTDALPKQIALVTPVAVSNQSVLAAGTNVDVLQVQDAQTIVIRYQGHGYRIPSSATNIAMLAQAIRQQQEPAPVASEKNNALNSEGTEATPGNIAAAQTTESTPPANAPAQPNVEPPPLITRPVAGASKSSFVHPGGLHTKEDLDRMRLKVAQKASPWIQGWNLMITDWRATNKYRPIPDPKMPNRQRAQSDAAAAYFNALRWYISGDTSHADCAVRILNAWSAAVADANPGPAETGLSGIPIGTFAIAAEVLRIYPQWADADQARFKKMLKEKLYPLAHSFVTKHNGRDPTSYYANWYTCNMLGLVAIGVYCDDRAIFNEGIEYFKSGSGTGAIMNATPFLYPDGLAQWQESGRDHAHAFGGMGSAAELCQIAWNQGIDLFGYANNRLLAAAEYEAQYAQWIGVPYTFYTNSAYASQFWISPNYRGRQANCEYYELLYNHYVVKKGLKALQTKRFAELLRPEKGNGDLMGYGTLTYTLDAAASPYPALPIPPIPQEVYAVPGLERVTIAWSPSGAYNTKVYEVLRSTSKGGPYTNIYVIDHGWTTPYYVDTKVTPGTTYYYVVAAKNNTGVSQYSAEVSAAPLPAGPLPKGWTMTHLGGKNSSADVSAHAAINGNISFRISSGPGNRDESNFVYQTVSGGDFTITARFLTMSETVSCAGLMMRESATPDSIGASTALEGRLTRLWVRSVTGKGPARSGGHSFVWPVTWFRLQRVGNKFTAYQSDNGITWYAYGSGDVPAMKGPFLVGLYACSNGEPKAATVLFDRVQLEVAPPKAPSVPSGLKAAVGTNTVNLTWTAIPKGALVDGFKVECCRDGKNFYEITDLPSGATSFRNTGLPAQTYQYRIRAYNTGGYSSYSGTVETRVK